MPVWNCLCSTKRKRRPEITSPILNTEGTDNLPQLIPQSTPASPGSYKYDKRQKLSSKKHRHLLAGNRDNCGDGGNENDNENDEKIKTKFLKKKESKKKCEIVKSRKQSNQVKLKQSKKETNAERKENNNKQKQEEHNNKLSKQLTNVRFAFETPSKTKTHHESVAKVNSTRINEEEEITEGGEEHERGDELHRCICNNNAKKEIFLRSFSSSPPSQVPLQSSPPESTSAATGAALYDVKKKDVFNEQNQEQQYQKQHQQKRGEEEQERRQQQQQSRSDNIETVDEEKTINENSGNYDEIPAVTIRTKTSLEETSLARSSNRPVHSNTVTTAETEIQVIVNEPCASYFPLSSNNSNSKSTFHSFKSATSPHHQLKIVGLSSNGAAVIGKSFHIGSHDSIPFIDEEMTISKSLASPALIIGSSESGKRSPGQNHENGIQENDHEARFITLQPKNIGSPHVIPEHIRAEQAQKYLESISSSQKDLNAFSTHHDIIIITEEYLDEQENKSQKEQSQGEKSTTIITTAGSSAHNHHNNKERNEFKNQKEIVDNPTAAAAVAVNHTGQNNGSSNSPMEKSVEHNFYVWQARNTRVCQVCHESLLIHSTSSLRCQSCDLVCHSWCASSMPSIRYHDTSYMIFRKWHTGNEERAFPTLYRSITNFRRKLENAERNLTDTECTCSKRVKKDAEDNDRKQSQQHQQHPQEQQHRKHRRKMKSSSEKAKRIFQIYDESGGDEEYDDDDGNDNDDIEGDNESILTHSMKRYSRSESDIGRDSRNLESIKLYIEEDDNRSSFSNNNNNNNNNNNSNNRKNTPITSLNSSQTSENRRNEIHKQNVVADIHRRPNSLVITEKEDKNNNFTKDEVDYGADGGSGTVRRRDRNCNELPQRSNSIDVNYFNGICSTDKNDAKLSKYKSVSTQSDLVLIEGGRDLRIGTGMGRTNNNYKSHNSLSAAAAAPSYGAIACKSIVNSWSADNITKGGDATDDYEEVVNFSKANDILNQRGQRIFQKSHNVENGEEHTIPKSQSFPAKGSSHLYQEASDALRLHYVTQRILATVLPRRSSIDPALRRSPSERVLQDKYEEEVILMLEQKHGKKYRVFDLESCISVVTLERICELCKHIDKWLNDGKDNVVVLQDRGDRQRLGTAIAAYLEYLDICGSNVTPRNRVANEDLQAQNTIARNWVALDIFSMKRFLEDFIGPLKLPSHRRYLNYFSGLLSGKIRMNSSPLNLRFISLESPSLWLQYNSNSKYSSQSEWSSFIKIYEGLRCIYTSDIHIIPITTRQFLFKTGNLRLRGDILIRCYQINFMENNNYTERCRELLFSIQFHTCAITKNEINFLKEDLDYAFNDPRLPRDHKVTFHFYSGNVSDTNGLIIQSPLIRTEPPNELARADSIERFDPSSAYHINGPIDGSLYATILKSPKSPSSEKFLTNNHNNNYSTLRTSSQRIKTQEQSNLISPPPQFSNGKSEIIKREPLNTSTPIKQIAISNNCVNFNNNNNSNNRLRSPSQTRSDYSYVDSGGSRPQTSQSNYQQQQPGKQAQLTIVRQTTYQSAEQNSNGHQDQDQHQQQHHHHHHHQQSRQSHHQHGVAGRESVRSPLTLSMDSGISSSGILNRPQQGSSVSPSSFPSQASPQEDRHRELDDILSDMLMNVRDIPDFGNSKTYNRQHQIGVQKIVRSQSVIPGASSSSNYSVIPVQRSSSAQYNHIANSNTLTVGKRSQSYLSAEGTPLGQSRGNSYLSVKDPRSENYETSSTTTLTPPPSESGRDTPVAVNGHIGYSSTLNSESSNIARSAIIEYREKREIHHNLRQQNSISNTMSERRPQSLNSRPAVQSSGYSQSVRTSESISSPIPATTSEDEENIPYHAREDSRPFTYGNIIPSPQLLNNTHNNNINNSKNHSNSQIITEQELLLLEENSDPAMIKAQSGLSSPSLVRKTLGGSAHTLRKTPPRNDFEELLRERREKVLSEKYSTLDKPLSAINTYNRNYERRYLNTDTWNSKDTPNGYYYYNEPLKRSNTLDGFHRSTSTDGLSGQTWLQLQQQKLRAKKDQQLREERRYYDELVQTEIRNSRPFRARYQRNDGYASDTAAFGDEVDYRRPLHIQTPSRSPERNYHTLSSTTTTTSVTKERPFVSVKRAHEQARKDTYGSPPLSPLSVLNTSPHGHIAQVQNQQNGLLSVADSPRNGQISLESDSNSSCSQNDNKAQACINVNNMFNSSSNNNNNNCKSNDKHTHPTASFANNKSNCYYKDVNTIASDLDHNIIRRNEVSQQDRNNNHFENGRNFTKVSELNSLQQQRTNSVPLSLPLQSQPLSTSSFSSSSSSFSSPSFSSSSSSCTIEKGNVTVKATTVLPSSMTQAAAAAVASLTDDISSKPLPPIQNFAKKEISEVKGCDSNSSPIETSNASGHLALDNLLALLAEETNLMNQMLSETKEITTLSANYLAKTESRKNGLNFIDHCNSIRRKEINKNHLYQDRMEHQDQQCRDDSLFVGWCGENVKSHNSNSNLSCNNFKHSDECLPPAAAVVTTGCGNINNNNYCSISNSSSNKFITIADHENNHHLISPSLSERSNTVFWYDQAREESFSSYRSETEPELSIAGSPRPETPAFPVTPRTPYGYTYNTNGSVSPALPPKSPTSQRKDLYTGSQRNQLHHEIVNQNEQISSYTTRRNSNASNANSEPQEVAPHHVKFVRDSSKYWYKPNLSRDEAVALLRNAVPGTFIVRDSTTFKNAFGLVVRVAFPPPGIASGPNGDELVRHFLVEPTSRGVRLKGCANEPVFTSLSALVYQHSITPLALPCRLLIPDRDIQFDAQTPAQKQLLTQGAACNVLYLFSCETESLTGEEAIRKAVSQLYSRKPLPTPTEVHFKVSLQGITLTDVTRQKFFRKHYPANAISFCGLDPDGRLWSVKAPIGDIPVNNKTIFAFVARRSASSTDNQCHVFCDLASAQPATAIISFANKTLPTEEIMNHNNI